MAEVSPIRGGTGKRKSAVARVRLMSGQGKVIINERPMEQYFSRALWRVQVRQPFEVTGTIGRYDAIATVSGGGLSGQAGAVRHGIARALLTVDAAFRSALKKSDLLTRDPREKERKKYGQKGARKRFQYSKR